VSLRAVLFDAGNTLLFLDYARLAPAVAEATGTPLTAEGLEAQAGPAAQVLEQAGTTDRVRATAYLEALFTLAGVPAGQLGIVRDVLYRLHHERHLWSGQHPGTRGGLERLRSAGWRMGVVSNSDGRAEEALAASGLRDFFELVIDSQLVGFEKPDPRIFEAALARMGLEAANTLYVGDIYEVDVVGARRAGMPAVLLDPRGARQGLDVTVVRSVAELADQLLSTPQGVLT
jgi:putative hydrolase of the HAD superfamily